MTERASLYLNALSGTCKVIEQVEAERALLVAQARDAGASWADVGRALGITRQGARQTYGPAVGA